MKDFAVTFSILSSFENQALVNRSWNLDSELASWRSGRIQADIEDHRQKQLNCLSNFEIGSSCNKLESLNLTMLLVEESLMMNFKLWFRISKSESESEDSDSDSDEEVLTLRDFRRKIKAEIHNESQLNWDQKSLKINSEMSWSAASWISAFTILSSYIAVRESYWSWALWSWEHQQIVKWPGKVIIALCSLRALSSTGPGQLA